MKIKGIYECRHAEPDVKALGQPPYPYQEIIQDPKKLVETALIRADRLGAKRITLPVNYLPEIIATGCEYRSDWLLGFMAKEPVFKDKEDFLENGEKYKLETSVYQPVLEGIKILKAENLTVQVMMMSTFGVMSLIIPAENLFVYGRKDVDFFQEIKKLVLNYQKDYIRKVSELGADFIHLDDSIATPNLVGKKAYKKTYGPIVKELLSDMEPYENTDFLICPRGFTSLLSQGFLKLDPMGKVKATTCFERNIDTKIGKSYSFI